MTGSSGAPSMGGRQDTAGEGTIEHLHSWQWHAVVTLHVRASMIEPTRIGLELHGLLGFDSTSPDLPSRVGLCVVARLSGPRRGAADRAERTVLAAIPDVLRADPVLQIIDTSDTPYWSLPQHIHAYGFMRARRTWSGLRTLRDTKRRIYGQHQDAANARARLARRFHCAPGELVIVDLTNRRG